MRAGKLNNRIEIEHKTESRDSYGGVVNTWATYKTVWAEILTNSGKEFINAKQQHSSLTAVMTIRFTEGVTTKMRVNRKGQYYNILAAFDPDFGRREIRLYCDSQL